ncbi:MAG: hypothetical protein JNM18_16970 [Planctomycetaceae bacterium]|nr:hypothetical protein [Planctomycetaceae bacterium]
MSDATPQPSPATPRRRSLGKWAVRLTVGLFALFVALPYLASIEPGRSWVLRRIFPNVRGTISAESTQFQWAGNTRIDGLLIRSPAGEPTVMVESIEVGVPFWKFLLPGSDLGQLTIIKPEVRVQVRDNSSNLAETFPPPANQTAPTESQPSIAAPAKPSPPRRTSPVAINVQDAIVSWNLPGTGQTHKVEHINFRAKIVPAGVDGFTEATLVIEPTVVLDRVKLTQAMSNDFLAFIAPPFAGVTKVEGEISLALNGGALPLHAPGQGKLTGQLGLHKVSANPSGIPKLIADKLKFPAPDFDFAPESIVPFELSDGRVTHRDLEFGLGGLRVQTAGSVSLKRQLDLLAHIHVRATPEQIAERPLLRALSERGVLLPIKGSLQEPIVDNHLLATEGLDLLSTALGNWRDNQPENVLAGAAQNLFESLRQKGIIVAPPPTTTLTPPVPGKPAPAGTEVLPAPPGQPATPPPGIPPEAAEIGKQALDLLQELAKQRRARLEQEAKQAPPGSVETPKKRPLGKLLDRLKALEPPQPEKPQITNPP